MTDFWGFLLQTLTASGAAVLLLVIKAMFRDKLSPRWQFAVWGVLGLVLLTPAGLGGRYVLINWPWLVETAKTFLTGDYSLTRVFAPIPLPRLCMPAGATEWLYAAYTAGALLLFARYVLSYLRLRLALRRGTPAGGERTVQIAGVAERYGLKPCRAMEVPGLKTAFICGVFRPVLALPAGMEVDDKVLLHELLHCKHRDAAWGLVICFFRCLHWCNPLLWYCAGQAGNDLEARCDQRALELLEGKERRDYGRILLSMADERYARTPGTSSMANGGRNIRARIEAIARFKKYPAGMALASVCVAVLLAAPLLLGVQAQGLYQGGGSLPGSLAVSTAMASARTLRCTTPAGALDSYGMAVLEQNGYYRAMCAPLSEQAPIADAMLTQSQWDSGLPVQPYVQSGYWLYNLEAVDENAYECLLVVTLGCPTEDGGVWLGVQRVRAERQENRWVVLPLEEFWTVETRDATALSWGCRDLPAFCYEDQAAGFTIRMEYQTVHAVESSVPSDSWFGSSSLYDTTPQPHAEFFTWNSFTDLYAIYTGDPADKESIQSIAVSYAPLLKEGQRPTLRAPDASSGWSSSDGSGGVFHALNGDWEPELSLSGGGGGGSQSDGPSELPAGYAADLYLNGEKAAKLTLLPVEGGGTP